MDLYDFEYREDLIEKSNRFIKNLFGGILITNLNNTDLFIINQCIIEFNESDRLFTAHAYDIFKNRLHGHFGLYKTYNGDLTEFWNRFDDLKGEK